MAVRRVERHHVHLRLDQLRHALQHVCGCADGRAAQQAARRIPCGIRVLHGFLNVLDRDEALQVAVLVHNRELLNAVLAEDLLRLLERRPHRRGHQVLLGHHGGDLLVEVRLGHEPQVAVGDDADQFAVLADRHTGNFVARHDVVRIMDKVVRREEKRVDDDAVFRALDPVHLVRLFFDRHVLVDDANAAFAGNGNRHLRLCDRIHGRGHQRRVQVNGLGQLGGDVHLLWQHMGFRRDQKDIVKCQPLFDKLAGKIRI